MDKVKLPREVAIAIDVLGSKWGRKAFLQTDFMRNSQHPEANIINEYFKPFHTDGQEGFDKLFFALYNGYEVEETPEDKVRKYYHSLKRDEDWEPDEYQRACGVMITLDLLGIKIEGVNA